MAKRVDDSHQPFKFTTKIGPGPKKRLPNKKKSDWECQKAAKAKGKKGMVYVQVCTYRGPDAKRRGKKRKVTRSVAAKKKYNKLYAAWRRAHAKKFPGKPIPSYKCRKTPATKCK